MPTEVVMPALGVAQETGKLLRWLKSEGESISAGEPLMEIETDKVTVEIEAPAGGTLAQVSVDEGAEVPVGRVVALILAPGETSERGDGPPRPPEAPTASAASATLPAPASAPPSPAPAAPSQGRKPASPLARRRAKEAGLDLESVTGTGPEGAVTAADLDAAFRRVQEAPPAPAREPARPVPEADVVPEEAEAVPLTAVWRRMVERTTESWTSAPHFFLFREVDAGRLRDWRQVVEHRGEEVTFTDLLVWLTARALRRHPQVNARLEEGRLSLLRDVNVGIAVAVEDGLIVPVVHGADRLSITEIAGRRKEVVDRARAGRLKPDDVRGGTFTVSNLGMYGVDGFAAVINPPQAAILAVGRIRERVVAMDGEPRVRPVMTLALSCDHRVLDGARAARFLATLASMIEEPLELLQ